MTDYSSASPKAVRELIREGQNRHADHRHVRRLCAGQPRRASQRTGVGFSADSASATRSPVRCWKSRDAGSRTFPIFGAGSDIARDIPKYRVYENGVMTGEYTDVSAFFDDPSRELVSFLIGCSFSFESALLEAGIPVRRIEEGVNVPMYNTNISCAPAGVFSGNMVVSMRPIPHALVPAAVAITAQMAARPRHADSDRLSGGHRHHDLAHPDYGDAVTIREGEVPVFWPCGVTPAGGRPALQAAVVITHAPGHMFITDVKNAVLKL